MVIWAGKLGMTRVRVPPYPEILQSLRSFRMTCAVFFTLTLTLSLDYIGIYDPQGRGDCLYTELLLAAHTENFPWSPYDSRMYGNSTYSICNPSP